jgi:hypothetical protein
MVMVEAAMTTAATLQSAARALKTAKPAGMWGIVPAIDHPKGRDFEAV